MNIGDTIAPNSDQMDAVDLLPYGKSGFTFTVKGVRPGNAEQPVQIDLAEFPRPWRPGKSMRRVLVSAWGPDASVYAGRRLTLFCDPTVKFGGAEVGGVRISRMSHIDKRQSVPLIVARGKSATFIVEPLPDAAPATPEPTSEQIADTTDKTALRAMWNATNNADLRAQITARVAELDTANGEQP